MDLLIKRYYCVNCVFKEEREGVSNSPYYVLCPECSRDINVEIHDNDKIDSLFFTIKFANEVERGDRVYLDGFGDVYIVTGTIITTKKGKDAVHISYKEYRGITYYSDDILYCESNDACDE